MSDTVVVGRTGKGVGSARRRRSSPARRAQNRAAYLFVAPFFFVFTAMLVVPMVYSGYLSLFQSKLIGGQTFAWFANYARAIEDTALHAGLGRMGLFLVIQVPIMLSLALFLALALDSGRTHGFKPARLMIFLPYAVPGVVATLMWGYIYGYEYGLLSQIVRGVGLEAPNLLTSETILGSIMNIVNWEFVGYNMIIMFSALRAIPTELYEAAEIDGASERRIAWSIKIPAIRPAIMMTVIFSIIGTFQLFNEPSLMDIIAPTAVDSAFTPNFYAYNLAFTNLDMNYAAAVAFLLGITIAAVSYVVVFVNTRRSR